MSEWSTTLRELISSGNSKEYHRVKERMSTLLELRRQVMVEKSEDGRAALRDEIIHLIEGSRKLAEVSATCTAPADSV